MARRFVAYAFLLIVLLALVSTMPVARAETQHYAIVDEQADVYIQKDGSIEIKYYLRMRVRSISAPVTYLKVYMPNRLFDHDSVSVTLTGPNIQGQHIDDITFPESDEKSFVIHFTGHYMLQPGHDYHIYILAQNPVTVFKDPDKSGRAMVEFTPTWFPNKDVQKLETRIHMPSGYTDVGNTDADDALNHSMIDDKLVYTWLVEGDLAPGEKRTYKVSFLTSAVDRVYDKFWDLELYNYRYHFAALVIVLVVVGIAALALRKRRVPYDRPEVRVEARGARKGLTQVEAAAILGLSDRRLMQIMLVELEMGNAIEVEKSKPFTAKPVPEMVPRGDAGRLVEAFGPDGKLDAGTAKMVIRDIKRRVKVALEGYDHSETKIYYRRISRTRWKQVGTKKVKKGRSPRPELDVLEETEPTVEVVLWLMLEDDAPRKFRDNKGLKVPEWYKWKVNL
jgi:hypothetical protein